MRIFGIEFQQLAGAIFATGNVPILSLIEGIDMGQPDSRQTPCRSTLAPSPPKPGEDQYIGHYSPENFISPHGLPLMIRCLALQGVVMGNRKDTTSPVLRRMPNTVLAVSGLERSNAQAWPSIGTDKVPTHSSTEPLEGMRS